MSSVFIDTAFLVAYLVSGDKHQQEAENFLNSYSGRLWTTGWIYQEVANFFSKSHLRTSIAPFLSELSADPRLLYLPPDSELFDRGLEMYDNRPDKHWSLTDCISFVVMTDNNLAEALTTDHHFKQAGFAIRMS